MVHHQSFMFSYHLQRELFEIITSLTRCLNVRDLTKEFALFTVLGLKIYIQHSSVNVLIQLRFFTRQLWKIFFEKRQGIRYLKPQYFKKRKRIWKYKKRRFISCIFKRQKYKKIRRIWDKKALFTTRIRFIKRRVYELLYSKRRFYKKRLLINRVDPFLTPRRYTRISKKVWTYFLVLPYLIYVKNTIIKTIFSKIVRPAGVKVFFLGVHQRSVNANMVIDFLVRRLEYRYYRISRLIYDALRILRRLVKTQKIAGYRFLLAGRFSRRDRATFIWKGYSSIPLSTKLSSIDYQYRYLQMRFSLGILKLWISRR